MRRLESSTLTRLRSLIDRETQYFIAEASRTADRSATETFEKHEKLQWLGCEGVSKSGKLCEVGDALWSFDLCRVCMLMDL